MPTIAIIAGVRIAIYPKDHLPPHLHAQFAEFEFLISICTGDVLEGSMPKAKLRAVQSWLAANRAQVAYVWQEVARIAIRRREDRSMNYRVADVSVVRYPVLKVTFNDGLSGEYDLTDLIARGSVFEPLRDPDYFAQVAVAPYGHSFGWNLHDEGKEIDFCPDATRIRIEEQKVAELAALYRASRSAAE